MSRSTPSRRGLAMLFAISGLCCGFVFFAARLSNRKRTPAPTYVLWKNRVTANQVAFSPVGRSITVVGISCQRFESKTGRLLSSWKLPFEGQITPDGESIICINGGKKIRTVTSKRVWQTTASAYPGGRWTVRTHSQPISISLYGAKFLMALDAETGTLQWKHPLPDDSPQRIYLFSVPGSVSNLFVPLLVTKRDAPKWQNTHSLLKFSRRNGTQLKRLSKQPYLSRYSDSTFAMDKKGDIWHKLKDAGDKEKEDGLLLQNGSLIRTFEVLPKILRNRFWIPLTFDTKDQFLSGMRSESWGAYSENDDVGRLYLWNSQGKLLWTDQQPKFTAKVIVFSPDSRYLAVGGIHWMSLDDQVFVYEVTTGKVVKQFTEQKSIDQIKHRFTKAPIAGFSGIVEALSWSPDGKLLAAGYGSNGFKLWKFK